MFDPYIAKWNLVADGEAIVTPSSCLLPVRYGGEAAMLKVAIDDEEKIGGALMAWWNGDGAAHVYAYDGTALVMERARDATSLLDMARDGRDDEASRIVCATIARLHAHRGGPPPNLVALADWFAALWPAAAEHGGLYARSATVARELLAQPRETVALHGDVHHRNVLDFGARGWLAIDPKRVAGDRGYDYANLICNPDLETVVRPARFARQIDVVADASGLGRRRLLQWVLAYAGLSAAWFLSDGDEAGVRSDLAVAALAAAALDA